MKRLLMIATLMVFLAVGVASAQPSLHLEWSRECAGQFRIMNGVVECWVEDVPPAPTETPFMEPTATPEPSATATPMPEPTAIPTVTPTATPDPVALCPHDDLRAWHSLEGNGCHYNHEHGDNPSLADAVFGPAGAWYGDPGFVIGGPWAMPNELTNGHNFWKYYVRLNINPAECDVLADNDACVTDFRLMTHVATGGNGVKSRYHSFMLEARACSPVSPADARRPDPPQDCGTLRVGGIVGYDNLYATTWFTDPVPGHQEQIMVPLPTHDGQGVYLGPAQRGQSEWRSTIWSNPPGPLGAFSAWYATDSNHRINVSPQVAANDGCDTLEPVPGDVILHHAHDNGAGCGSNRNLRILSILALPGRGGSFTWVGDPMGDPLGESDPNCSLGQAGCGYMVADNWPQGRIIYQARDRSDEYDTTDAMPDDGASWIVFPN